MVGAVILAGLALLGMSITIIGIPFAIYFGVRWTFIWQAVLVEGTGSRAALSRSSDLVKENWWRVLGIVLVVSIIAGAISSILSFIPIIGAIIGTILTTPILITGATLLYYDLRAVGRTPDRVPCEIGYPGTNFASRANTLFIRGSVVAGQDSLHDEVD